MGVTGLGFRHVTSFCRLTKLNICFATFPLHRIDTLPYVLLSRWSNTLSGAAYIEVQTLFSEKNCKAVDKGIDIVKGKELAVTIQ